MVSVFKNGMVPCKNILKNIDGVLGDDCQRSAIRHVSGAATRELVGGEIYGHDETIAHAMHHTCAGSIANHALGSCSGLRIS